MTDAELFAELDRIAATPDDFYGEDAIPPSAESIARARELLVAMLAAGLRPDDVDFDVDGGVVLRCYSLVADRTAWFDLWNDGSTLVTMYGGGGGPHGYCFDDDSVREVVEFLESSP